eukprot:1348383-Amphidinium_carterae.1
MYGFRLWTIGVPNYLKPWLFYPSRDAHDAKGKPRPVFGTGGSAPSMTRRSYPNLRRAFRKRTQLSQDINCKSDQTFPPKKS